MASSDDLIEQFKNTYLGRRDDTSVRCAANWVPAQAGTHRLRGTTEFVYLLASRPYGTLYTGSTFDLLRRVFDHKARAVPGFAARYRVDRLMWYEAHETLEGALIRERQLKKWKRDWKINLVERDNPRWTDLAPSLTL